MKQGFFHGIFFGSLHSFFVALMATFGVFVGLFLFFALIGGISASTKKEVERTYDLEILPNADNVRKALSSKAPVILQLNIDGLIGTETFNMNTIRKQLIESREGDLKDNRVRAILLNINTPGGTVVDSDGIYRFLKSYKEQYKVPIYAHIDGLCASGGMYSACAADKIYATEVSVIGSIGVLSQPPFMNFSKLLETIGVESLTISEGKGKDAMNPFRPWKPDEDAVYKQLIKYYYDMFVNVVIAARPKLSKEKLIEDYGAAVFPASIAKEHGYIDGSGVSRNEALKLLLKEIGIEDDYYQVMQFESNNWVAKIFNSKNPILQGRIEHRLELPEQLHSKLSSPFLYLYQPGR